MDQRTFAPARVAPTDAARPLPALPLAVLRLDQGLDRAMLADVVGRRPAGGFEVVAMLPTGASREADAAALKQGAADAETVAMALLEAGAAREKVTIGARGESGLGAGREVRIYGR